MLTRPVAPPVVRPPRDGGQVGRGRPRGGGQQGRDQPVGTPAWFYAFPARPDVEASDVVIIGIISICGKDASVLFDPGSSYSDVSSLFSPFLGVSHESSSSPVYVSTHIDCHAKTVTLAILALPRLEWKGLSVSSFNRVISYIKAQHMVEKGCLAYLAYVRDTTAETLAFDLVLVVREFSDIFSFRSSRYAT
ncbi:uncharacterized protein [Nicotiana tomentosiformis]|uniref:uncharacterized protein n=1 Tax=Nicotiana tomentosiformis TaxID=4098 RepID=UPI00388CC4C2